MNDVSPRTPKLLFIGHKYHNKTKSSQFITSLLALEYEIEYFDCDPLEESIQDYIERLQSNTYETVVLWQIMPDIPSLKRRIKYKNIAFFPMYDAVNWSDRVWESYYEVNIISFSRTLYEKLIRMNFQAYYIQYFPTPRPCSGLGDLESLYFWQRTSNINAHTVEKLISNLAISRIYIHKALDPQHQFVEPSKKIVSKVVFSEWYEDQALMWQDIESSSLFVAPRLYEGIGMSFLEAMAMGRCVLAPNFPTMNEYIVHNVNGILYDNNKIQPLPDNLDIRSIQHRTIEYMNAGFIKWQSEKMNILRWITQPIPNIPFSKRGICTYSSLKLGQFPILTIVKKFNKINVYLFTKLRVLRVKNKQDQKSYYLFGFILLPKCLINLLRCC